MTDAMNIESRAWPRQRCRPIAIALLLMLCACDNNGSADPSSSDEPAANIDQSTVDQVTKVMANDPGLPADYVLLREAAIALDEPGLDGIEDDGRPPSIFDVIDCAEGYHSVEPRDLSPDEENRERLARRSVMLERDLRVVGYDAATISDPMREYQLRMLALIADSKVPPEPTLPDYYDAHFIGDENRGPGERSMRELAHLALALDESRQRLQPDLPPVEARGECGAGEQPFLIRSEPAGAKVWIATRFAYSLCNARHIDGWDRVRCPRWSEMDPAVPAALSGTYMYQARWPDGRQVRGTRTLDGLTPVTEDGSPVTVTVQPD